PLRQLVARKDGWIVAGWHARDAVGPVIEGSLPGETILQEPRVPATPVPAEVLSGGGIRGDAVLAVVR
ncbi:MAG: hypothetical protein ACKO6B_11540, partial [Planctomycetia bacterium]